MMRNPTRPIVAFCLIPDKPRRRRRSAKSRSAWSGRTLAATGGQKIYLWNTVTGKLAATITGPPGLALFSLAFSPDGRSVAACGVSPAAYVWDTATGKLAAVFRDPSGAATSSLAYSPDGRTLAVSDYDGDIYLWNVCGLP